MSRNNKKSREWPSFTATEPQITQNKSNDEQEQLTKQIQNQIIICSSAIGVLIVLLVISFYFFNNLQTMLKRV